MNKNIFLLPTEKPSRLHIGIQSNALSYFQRKLSKTALTNPQNIYITNNEKIKEGDCFYNPRRKIIQKAEKDSDFKTLNSAYKIKGVKPYSKIILTTDQDLIKDGMQEIPTDFLEWFVNNSECESVEVRKEKQHFGEEVDESYPKGFFNYKIIIPQDQPKQTIYEVAQEYALRQPFNTTSCYKSFIQGYNHAQKEIEELRRDKQELVNELKDIMWLVDNDELFEEIIKRLKVSKQLITKHNG
jgi:hypothetical protein